MNYKKYKHGGGVLPMSGCDTKAKMLMVGGQIDMTQPMVPPMKSKGGKMAYGGPMKKKGYGGPVNKKVKKMNMGGRTNGSRTYSGK